MSSPEQNDSRGRLLTYLFWGGIVLAPLAALLLIVVGSSTAGLRVAAILAIFAVMAIGLSIMLKRDATAMKLELEDTMFEEIDALRNDVRADITTAARATHRALSEKVAQMHDSLEQVRRRAEAAPMAHLDHQVARSAVSAPPRRPGITAGPGDHHGAVGPAGPGIVQRTDTVRVTTRTIVDPDEDSHSRGRARPSGERGPRELPSRDVREIASREVVSRDVDRRAMEPRADRDRHDVRDDHDNDDVRDSRRGRRDHHDHDDEYEHPGRDQRWQFDRRDEQRRYPEERYPEERYRDERRREKRDEPDRDESDRSDVDRLDRDRRRQPPERAEQPQRPSEFEMAARQAWSETPGDLADDPRWAGMRAGDRWAEVRQDEHGRELRIGERRAAIRTDETGTHLRVVDRWSTVREDHHYTRSDDTYENTGETRAQRRAREASAENGAPAQLRSVNGAHVNGRSHANGFDDSGDGWDRPSTGRRPALPSAEPSARETPWSRQPDSGEYEFVPRPLDAGSRHEPRHGDARPDDDPARDDRHQDGWRRDDRHQHDRDRDDRHRGDSRRDKRAHADQAPDDRARDGRARDDHSRNHYDDDYPARPARPHKPHTGAERDAMIPAPRRPDRSEHDDHRDRRDRRDRDVPDPSRDEQRRAARSADRSDDRWEREPSGPRPQARPRQYGFEVTDERWH